MRGLWGCCLGYLALFLGMQVLELRQKRRAAKIFGGIFGGIFLVTTARTQYSWALQPEIRAPQSARYSSKSLIFKDF